MSKKPPIKLIALDIDGTIMDKDFNISQRVKEAIFSASQKGIKVLLATGRMHVATEPIAKELNLKTPIITYQGSLVKNDEKEFLHHKIDKDIALKLVSELREYKIQINTYLDDELVVEEASPFLIKYANDRNINYKLVESFESIDNFTPTKIIVINEDKEKISTIRDVFKKNYSDILYVTKSTPIYCEFVNKQASKGNAISYLANKWDIKPSEIMVAGDQDNDKEMLEMAGFSVAMGNAVEEIKQIADYVTDTVDNDGIAKVIEEFIL